MKTREESPQCNAIPANNQDLLARNPWFWLLLLIGIPWVEGGIVMPGTCQKFLAWNHVPVQNIFLKNTKAGMGEWKLSPAD